MVRNSKITLELDKVSFTNKLKKKQGDCFLHNEDYILFCKNCSNFICSTCKDGKEHDSHQLLNLEEGYEFIKKLEIQAIDDFSIESERKIEILEKDIQDLKLQLKKKEDEYNDITHKSYILTKLSKDVKDTSSINDFLNIIYFAKESSITEDVMESRFSKEKIEEIAAMYLDKNLLYQAIYAEALDDINDPRGQELFLDIIKQKTKNKYDEMGVALCLRKIGKTKEAIDIFKKYSDHYFAQCNIGSCYGDLKENPSEKIEYYRKSAEQEYSWGEYNLAVCYEDGDGVEQNLDAAVRFYNLAAENGNSYALNNLGRLYQNGKGVKKDIKEAFRLYNLSAAQGNGYAFYNLGVLYETGNYVEKNLNEAFRYFALSASKYNSFGQNSLGICYEIGSGVQMNVKEAAKLFKYSASQGNYHAMYNLGKCYQSGRGVEKDLDEAKRLFMMASDHGHSGAQLALKEIKLSESKAEDQEE